MSNLPKGRFQFDAIFKLTLKDSGVSVNWNSVDIRQIFMYSLAQKAQARTNINAADYDLTDSLEEFITGKSVESLFNVTVGTAHSSNIIIAKLNYHEGDIFEFKFDANTGLFSGGTCVFKDKNDTVIQQQSMNCGTSYTITASGEIRSVGIYISGNNIKRDGYIKMYSVLKNYGIRTINNITESNAANVQFLKGRAYTWEKTETEESLGIVETFDLMLDADNYVVHVDYEGSYYQGWSLKLLDKDDNQLYFTDFVSATSYNITVPENVAKVTFACYKTATESGNTVKLSFYLASSMENATIYVSSSDGDDSNEGTEDAPLKTLSYALSKSNQGNTIRLKCGDTFYGSSYQIYKRTIDSYSEGNKPVLSNIRIVDCSSTPFTSYSTNIWKIDMSSISSEGIEYAENQDVASIYSFDSDEIVFGHRVNFMTLAAMQAVYGSSVTTESNQPQTYMHQNGDFYQNESTTVYVYYDGNPNEDFNKLGFTIIGTAMAVDHATIRNIKLFGFGTHGINSYQTREDILIENVDIDVIGGAAHCSPVFSTIGTKSFVRLGNGVELWRNTIHTTVRNCRISRTFDCGITIQGSLTANEGEDPSELPSDYNDWSVVDKRAATNCVFENNLIYNCREGIEVFNHMYATDDSGNRYVARNCPYYNCSIRYNKFFDNGNNGFKNCSEARDASMYCGINGCTIEGNLFYVTNTGFWFWHVDAPDCIGRGNIVYIKEGTYLVLAEQVLAKYPKYSDQKTGTIVCPSNQTDFETAISQYREINHDEYTKFILISDTTDLIKDMVIQKLFNDK